MNRAKQLRIDNGLTQTQVAEMTGVAQRTVARLEREEGGLRAPSLKAIADFYGVPASSLTLPADHEPPLAA
jgi:transcriptional regulator with XRE-family HTH domain